MDTTTTTSPAPIHTCRQIAALRPAGACAACAATAPRSIAEAVDAVIALAERHAGNGAAMASSAQLCLADARRLLAAGRRVSAYAAALRSLRYSVGILHGDHAWAASVLSVDGENAAVAS